MLAPELEVVHLTAAMPALARGRRSRIACPATVSVALGAAYSIEWGGRRDHCTPQLTARRS